MKSPLVDPFAPATVGGRIGIFLSLLCLRCSDTHLYCLSDYSVV